jgi:hypothetical protein
LLIFIQKIKKYLQYIVVVLPLLHNKQKQLNGKDCLFSSIKKMIQAAKIIGTGLGLKFSSFFANKIYLKQ